MKTLRTILMTAGLFPGFIFAQDHSSPGDSAASEHPPGTAHVFPQAMRTEFENDAVQVLRLVIGPHQKIPMHEISPRVVIWVNAGRLKLTFPDGNTKEEVHHAGEIAGLEAQKHAGENLGGDPIELIAVIPKGEMIVRS
jgi:quercetin dioxygenase-like cupin family protein